MSILYTHAYFDVDGTLCDPGESIARAAQFALARVDIHEPDLSALRRFVGPPLEHSFRDYYNLSPELISAAVQSYRSHKTEFGMGGYVAYDGVLRLLQSLRQQHVVLNVVTSKLSEFAEHALRSTGLLDFFDEIYACPSEEAVTKDHILAEALLQTQPLSGRAVMIGDRRFDIEAARMNGIDSVGVLYGYGTADELAEAGAIHLAATPEAIEARLANDASDAARVGTQER